MTSTCRRNNRALQPHTNNGIICSYVTLKLLLKVCWETGYLYSFTEINNPPRLFINYKLGGVLQLRNLKVTTLTK